MIILLFIIKIIIMGRNPKHLSKIVWEHYNGQVWSAKCYVPWCNNVIDCMSSNWHLGHNIPESKGGETCLENLRPICSDCNLGMGSRMSIDEWTFKYVSTAVSYTHLTLPTNREV